MKQATPKHLTPSTKIYLADSEIQNAGRGVFAAADITKGEEIEVCPILEVPAGADFAHMKQTRLYNYFFIWSRKDETDETKKQAVICLGFGSLYNHSYEPNTTYQKDIPRKTITFVAVKNITKGQEITINYNYGDPNDKSKLWIKDVPAQTKSKR